LDKELERRGHRFARYADDCNVYVQSRRAGERVMTSLESFLSKRLRLPINREKSAVARPWARKFLGYTVTTSRKLKVAPQSLRRLQGRIRALCRQARGWRLDRLIETLRPIIRGWIAYFQLSEVKVAFVRLDEWRRRRLRCILWRQWKRPLTRQRRLMALGLDPDRAHRSAYNGRGPWWNAGASHMNQAIPLAWLRRRGLMSFLDQYQRLKRTS
jgi:RNA-directed DNA polymerase